MIRGQIIGQTSDFVQIIPPDRSGQNTSMNIHTEIFRPEAIQSLPLGLPSLASRLDMPHGHNDTQSTHFPRDNAQTYPRNFAPNSTTSPLLLRNPVLNVPTTPSAVTVEELLELVQEQRKVIDLMEAQQKMQQDFADDPVEASSLLPRLEEMQRDQVSSLCAEMHIFNRVL
jgi:hypothetical protein